MDADGGENIGIGGRHDRRRCAASREPRDIDSTRIGGELLDHLHGDASDERWLAAVALLVTGVEPVPAFLHVCRLGLTRIGDQERLLLGHFVHPGACGEVVWVLSAAVQHDHDREGLTRVTAGNIYLVAPTSCGVRKGSLLKSSPFRHVDRRLSRTP
jgi:hypothetical protein